jgi:porin
MDLICNRFFAGTDGPVGLGALGAKFSRLGPSHLLILGAAFVTYSEGPPLPLSHWRCLAHSRNVWIGLAVLLPVLPAAAQAPEDAAPPADIWHQDTLTGDWGGLRSKLDGYGITLGATETSEVLANISGGVRRGAIYEGRLELDLDLDLAKLAGWGGATVHVSAYQIHGRGLSSNYLGGNILDVSSIEALRATRLFDAYLEQSLLGDTVSVRVGQIAADDEFLISQYAGSTFVNGTFGWPGIQAADLPSGGPAYPLATPGLRIRYQPNDSWSWQTALFNGDPAGAPGAANPQLRNASGTTFSTDQHALVMTELAYATKGSLPATYKLGAWYHSGRFADQRFDASGRSLASPASGGQPVIHSSDYGFYAIIDHMLWAAPGGEDHGLAGFLRLAGAPDDRNLVSFYADAGLAYKAPFAGRDNDIVGLGFAIARIGDRASDLDRDIAQFTRTARPVRDYEAVVELTYQYVAAPWWTIQPDLQYVIHPGGSVPDPTSSAGTRPIRDAFVIGLRTAVRF